MEFRLLDKLEDGRQPCFKMQFSLQYTQVMYADSIDILISGNVLGEACYQCIKSPTLKKVTVKSNYFLLQQYMYIQQKAQ